MSLGFESHFCSPDCIKKIIFKWSCLKVGLHKGHASRATPMSLESERHSFSPNILKSIIFKWSRPKIWPHIGHAWRTIFMSLGSERHLFSPNNVKKLYLNGLSWRLNFTEVMPQGPHQCLLDPRDIPSIQSLSKHNKKKKSYLKVWLHKGHA
jgi:hypothetical protein